MVDFVGNSDTNVAANACDDCGVGREIGSFAVVRGPERSRHLIHKKSEQKFIYLPKCKSINDLRKPLLLMRLGLSCERKKLLTKPVRHDRIVVAALGIEVPPMWFLLYHTYRAVIMGALEGRILEGRAV